MPQMAPINWLTLYFMFTSILYIFIILNYYSIIYSSKSTKSTKKMSPLFWKW
uniref:ATP synthase complex subunit 8 n=1 Tax=Tropiphorus elevatus TaxID=1342132 RepID=A0A343C492_9CUCU|nr:ATP synthase F0 subunit 8 [Tropiphorus elevatus]